MDCDSTTGAGRPEGFCAPIFIVDDESDVCGVIDALLELKGYETRIFTDSEEALKAFIAAEVKPRLMISDYQMPKLNGMELLQLCRAEHPELRCISASGTLEDEDMLKYPSQPDRLLPKPFRSQQLWDLVEEMLAD